MDLKTQQQNVIIGNSEDLNIDPNAACEVRADVSVFQYTPIKIWGQILDHRHMPIPMALVKLVKIIGTNENRKYQNIAYTTSNPEGYYQFELFTTEAAWYKVLVGKTNTGQEIIVEPDATTTHEQTSCQQFSYSKPPYQDDGAYDC